ncbi:unnamed protein product [Arctia plantaginis]|uniref:MADF domain-containing protein n=1 Tax=Arctia plantaginis TaxID=874455 RepID=A0A8S1B648_ARCPL|nr:unnamed protein product [Arctia plantaginis]
MIPTRDLIEMVRVRRCLWDRKFLEYRDKAAKDRAWDEIYKKFEPNFDSFNQAKKSFIGNTITSKWHNARDSYVKSRKGGSRNKPYLYSEELSFLEETLNVKKNNKSYNSVEEVDEAENEESQNWINEVFVDIDESATENENTAKRRKIEYDVNTSQSPKETPKEDCDDNIVSVLVNLIQKEEDEDRAFFKSITPSVKTLSESSKFEFRIQVMKLINSLKMRDAKMIKLKRERTSTVESDSD